jgi:signal transduction histidine kinase
VLLASLAGCTRRTRAQLSARLNEAAARDADARRERLRAAAAEARRRLARERHDVVARSLGAMVAQAGGARTIVDRDPARAAAAAARIERTGREATAELRRLTGRLHPEEHHPALAPQPSLAQLDSLVARARAVGLPARGPAPTSVTLRRDGLELEVRDAGPERDGGHGLLAMREWVRLYDGELETAQPPHGGWIVRARLPLVSEREAVPGVITRPPRAARLR